MNLAWRMTVDPGGEKDSACPWVFFVFATAELDKRKVAKKYFHFYVKKTMGYFEAAETIYQLWRPNPILKPDEREKIYLSYKPHPDLKPQGRRAWWKTGIKSIGYEIAGQQEMGLTAIKTLIRNRHNGARPFFIPLKHPPSEASKDERIETLEPQYRNNEIEHSVHMTIPNGLESQLLKFPRGKKDIADAAAMTTEISKPAPRLTPIETPPKNADEMFLRAEEKKFRNRQFQTQIHSTLGGQY